MGATLGANWEIYFDFCLTNACKPLFFRTEKPFYTVDRNNEENKGMRINTIDSLWTVSPDKFFIEGNAMLITEYMQKVTKKKDARIAYFGDHCLNDVRATYEFNEKL